MSIDFRIYTDCNRSLLEKATQIQKAFQNHDINYYIDFLQKSKDKNFPVEVIIDNNFKKFIS